MGYPAEKKINYAMSVSVSEQGYPYWTNITIRDMRAGQDVRTNLHHEEARDLLYAMQRIVAFLDSKDDT